MSSGPHRDTPRCPYDCISEEPMKKKVTVVGLLAGAVALTGLAGSAYADGGMKPGPGKAPGAGGRLIAAGCVGKGVPGKGVQGVPGMGVPGKGATRVFRVKDGAKGTTKL